MVLVYLIGSAGLGWIGVRAKGALAPPTVISATWDRIWIWGLKSGAGLGVGYWSGDKARDGTGSIN